MAKWVRAGVLDSGLNDIRNAATTMLLISNYVAGDSYAVVFGNRLNAGVAMIPADYTLASVGNNRTLTTASGKTANATASAAAPDLHIAFTDGAANVIWVTDEISNQPITNGNPLTLPALVYTNQQPA